MFPPGTFRQVPLAELEGVQEHLANVGGNTLLATSAQALMNSMLNAHEQPAVLSAIMKQQMTTMMRQNINDGMDVRECRVQRHGRTEVQLLFVPCARWPARDDSQRSNSCSDAVHADALRWRRMDAYASGDSQVCRMPSNASRLRYWINIPGNLTWRSPTLACQHANTI